MARYFLIALACLVLSKPAFAGAWTQKRGAKQIITTGSLYRASRYFDATGEKRPQPTYLKNEVAAYGEYGLTTDWTLGGQLRVTSASQNGYSAKHLGDSEIFVRRRVWQDALNVVSLQPSIVLPSPDNKRTTPKIGADHMAYGLRASYGRNFKLLGKWHYADMSGGYLYRAGTPDNQYVLDTTVGFNVTGRWQVVPQLFITKSAHAVQAASFSESSANDYDLMKAQLTVQYAWPRIGNFGVGLFDNVRGRNTGQGGGVLVSYGLNFP